MNRLYGVLDTRLTDRDFVAGPLSIADFAIWPWAILADRAGQDLADFPNVKAWIDRCGARDGFAKGKAVGADLRKPLEADTDEAKTARTMLFGQTARR
jgi:GST-like protein